MLWEELKSRLLRYPNSLVCNGNKQYTYVEYLNSVERLKEYLLKILSPGLKCAVLCQSELNSGIAILACIASEITAIPLSLRYGKLHCKKILDSTAPNLIITDNLEKINFLNDYNMGILGIDGSLIRSPTPSQPEDELNDVALILCTSGTTGMPKGAMITQNNLWSNLCDIDDYFNIDKTDNILISRSIYHCSVLTGEFLISLIKGLDIYFYETKFDPIKVLQYSSDHQISVLCGTPTMFGHLCRFAKRLMKLPNLKASTISGECMTIRTAQLMDDVFPHLSVYNVYGLTEASPRVCYLPPDKFFANPLAVEKALRSVKIKIVNEYGQESSINECGELIVSGPNVMKGYYHNPIATKKAIRDGWLHTGDIAFKDTDGLITVISRKDNMIIRSGMNIYPQEIENALKLDERITDVLAYGLPCESTGQKIIVKIVPATSITKEAIYRICKSVLPIYQLPDEIEMVNELPRNGSGKIIRPKVGTWKNVGERIQSIVNS